MKIIKLLILLILLNLFACNFAGRKSFETEEQSTVWIYAWFNTKENSEDNFNYYFGEVDSSLYTEIFSNVRKNGFITLRNIRFWNNDDKLQSFEDKYSTGIISFKISNIEKMELLKDDPLLLYPKEEIDSKTYQSYVLNLKNTAIKEIVK